MTRSILLLVMALGVWSPLGIRQTPVFRAGTSAVMVDVSVKTRSGRVVTGLTAADFVVQDNGVVQDVSAISYGKLPIDVTVGLDVSHSVTGLLLDALRRAVTALVRDLREGDRLKLMAFNTWVTRTVDFTNDVSQIERALRAVSAGGGTALFDTLSVALTSATDPGRRQLVVFFTDGGDSSSTTSPATMVEIANRSRATVSFVVTPAVIAPAVPVASFAVVRESTLSIDPVIRRLAVETGGAVMAATASDLSLTFLRALDAFRTAYVLHYSPRGVDRGGFHTIEVRVNRPDTVVQARRGYFGG
jgi:VWFA-related protein